MARAKTVRINPESGSYGRGDGRQHCPSSASPGGGEWRCGWKWTLSVRLFRGGRIEGEINRRLDTLPPFPGDPIYLEMVQQLMLNLGASSGVTEVCFLRFGGGSGSDGFQDAPSVDSGSGPVSSGRTGPTGQMPEEDSGPGLPESLGKDRRPWWKFWGSKDAKPVTGRINVGGRSPLAENWWVWAAGGAVVAGGGVAAVLLLNSSGGVAQSTTGSSYTLTIETE